MRARSPSPAIVADARTAARVFLRRSGVLLIALAAWTCSDSSSPHGVPAADDLTPRPLASGSALLPTGNVERMVWRVLPADHGGPALGDTPASTDRLLPTNARGASRSVSQSLAQAAGTPKLVWQNTLTGERVIWDMNGPVYAGTQTSFVVNTNWEIVASADFTADGQPDLVWQNNVTGERVIWQMNGNNYSGIQSGFSVNTNWDIVAAADFTGDAKPDLVWQNKVTGERVIWQMNGVTYTGTQAGFGVNTAWDIVAAADFTGDNAPDLVWQNKNTGERVIWQMTGTAYSGNQTSFGVGTNWDIVAAADFTADGKADLVWQNKVTGERVIWQMNGQTYSGIQTSFGVNTNWQIATVFDVGTAPPTRATLSPYLALVDAAATRALTPAFFDANGASMPLVPATFTSRNTAIATVSAAGVVTGVAVGQTIVVVAAATAPTVKDSVLVVVTSPAGQAAYTDVGAFGLTAGQSITIPVSVDMRASGKTLGSSKIGVSWNASVLTYQGIIAYAGPLKVANTDQTASGSLWLALADGNGLAGKSTYFGIMFRVSSTVGALGAIGITVAEANAGDFSDIAVSTRAVIHPLVVK